MYLSTATVCAYLELGNALVRAPLQHASLRCAVNTLRTRVMCLTKTLVFQCQTQGLGATHVLVCVAAERCH